MQMAMMMLESKRFASCNFTKPLLIGYRTRGMQCETVDIFLLMKLKTLAGHKRSKFCNIWPKRCFAQWKLQTKLFYSHLAQSFCFINTSDSLDSNCWSSIGKWSKKIFMGFMQSSSTKWYFKFGVIAMNWYSTTILKTLFSVVTHMAKTSIKKMSCTWIITGGYEVKVRLIKNSCWPETSQNN